MSLLPFLIDTDRTRHLANQHFALALTPEDILNLIVPRRSEDTFQNWKFAPQIYDAGSTIKTDKDKFQINLDVQHFSPEEITVKTVEGFVVIEAKHEEKKDNHGWVSRQFVRRYLLPKGYDINEVQSRLSSDGVLTVTAPLQYPRITNERIVPIIQTGPVKTQIEGTMPEGGDGEATVKVSVENVQ